MKTERTPAMQDFIDAYLVAALWSSTDDDGNPLDESGAELHPDAHTKLESFAEAFAHEHADLLARAVCRPSHNDTYIDDDGAQRYRAAYGWDYAGHDLWLTQHHHGAGYWDRDLPDDLGDALTDAAQRYAETPLYMGDDGMIYAG